MHTPIFDAQAIATTIADVVCYVRHTTLLFLFSGKADNRAIRCQAFDMAEQLVAAGEWASALTQINLAEEKWGAAELLGLTGKPFEKALDDLRAKIPGYSGPFSADAEYGIDAAYGTNGAVAEACRRSFTLSPPPPNAAFLRRCRTSVFYSNSRTHPLADRIAATSAAAPGEESTSQAFAEKFRMLAESRIRSLTMRMDQQG